MATPEQRKLEKQLARAAALSAIREREKGHIKALLVAAQLVLMAEAAEIAVRLSEGGIGAAQRMLETVSPVWAARWIGALSGPLFNIMDGAPIPTDKGSSKLPLNITSNEGREFFEGYVSKVAEQVTSTSQSKIGEVLRKAREEGLSVDEARKRVQEAAPEMARYRAEAITRNELLSASKAAAHHKAVSSGVLAEKSRHDSADERVRPKHQEWDGERVGINEKFSSEEDYPGETEFACRCSVRYHLDPQLLGGANG